MSSAKKSDLCNGMSLLRIIHVFFYYMTSARLVVAGIGLVLTWLDKLISNLFNRNCYVIRKACSFNTAFLCAHLKFLNHGFTHVMSYLFFLTDK